MKNAIHVFIFTVLLVFFNACFNNTDDGKTNSDSASLGLKELDNLHPANGGNYYNKEVTGLNKIDDSLALTGEKIFKTRCIACHKTEGKNIGPEMKGVTKKRSPVWLMNMIMYPTRFTCADTAAAALLKKYDNLQMTYQDITENEARAVLEFLRKNDQ